MTQRKIRYIARILITLLSVLLTSCSDNSVPTGNNIINPVAIITDPMWPQSGYNAQNTSSPYAPHSYCNPVNLGEVDWYYDFGSYNYDGAEFCVDSKNNVYFLWQGYPRNKVFKFRQDGTVIWIKDSLSSPNYAGFSLSPDETKIYINNDFGLYCIDSSGILKWTSTNSGYYTKPAVGKDGTIYTKNWGDIAAINPDGSLKWTTNAGLSPFSVTKVALDRDENVYTAERKITKTDKNGNIKWAYTPKELDFLTEGLVIDGFGNIYFVNERNNAVYNLYSISKDGVLRWASKIYTGSSPVIGPQNKLYMVGNNAYCFDTAGKEIWTKPLPGGVNWGYSLVIDDKENMYFLYDNLQLKAVSLNSAGEPRWMVDLSISGLLPGPSLIPMGRMLVAPKRAGKIACVR